jgi:enoyl-CoA hydratase
VTRATISYQYLRLDRRGGVTYVTLNRPDKLNAVTMEMSREILSCIQFLSDDDSSRVVVLTGEGRAFCAGGDLSLEDSFTQHSFKRELELYADTVLAILSCTKPIICEMNGDAVGWGATIALFCDIIIADQTARIGDPHVNVGLSTGDGASVIWPQLAGYPRAKQFLLTGELMNAATALSLGLVSEVVDGGRLRARVDEIADKIASKPALAIAMTKASINIPLKELVRTSMDAYISYEVSTQQHPDHPAAVKRFLDRRANKTVPSGERK